MKVSIRFAVSAFFQCAAVCVGLLLLTANPLVAQMSGARQGTGRAGGDSDLAADCDPAVMGSPYIPVDSWIYPAVCGFIR